MGEHLLENQVNKQENNKQGNHVDEPSLFTRLFADNHNRVNTDEIIGVCLPYVEGAPHGCRDLAHKDSDNQYPKQEGEVARFTKDFGQAFLDSNVNSAVRLVNDVMAGGAYLYDKATGQAKPSQPWQLPEIKIDGADEASKTRETLMNSK